MHACTHFKVPYNYNANENTNINKLYLYKVEMNKNCEKALTKKMCTYKLLLLYYYNPPCSMTHKQTLKKIIIQINCIVHAMYVLCKKYHSIKMFGQYE